MTETTAPPLLPLAQAPAELELVKESWNKGVHDLMADGNSYARLDYALWSGRCNATTTDGSWAFSRPHGFFHNQIDVLTGGGAPVGELDLSVWHHGGTFALNGTDYRISEKGLLGLRTDVRKGDVILFEVKQSAAMGAKKASVTIMDAGRTEPDAALLLMLAVDLVLVQEHSGGGGWV